MGGYGTDIGKMDNGITRHLYYQEQKEQNFFLDLISFEWFSTILLVCMLLTYGRQQHVYFALSK